MSNRQHSRAQWKQQAPPRGDHNRYQRTQIARLRAERHRATQARKETQAQLRQLAAGRHAVATRPKVDVVSLALQLFFVARLGLRAVCRVLRLLAVPLGINKAPWPQTVSTGVSRLPLVRLDAARQLRGLPVSPAPCTNGLIWLSDLSLGLGSGTILAVLAWDAPPHRRSPGAPSLAHTHCIGVSVADAWTGDPIAGWRERLIARLGRPTADRKDAGSALPNAVAWLDDQGRASPCLDDISHAVAGMLQRS